MALAGHRGEGATALGALDDPEPAVRATALRALARMGALELAQLERAAHDTDAGVRGATAEVIGVSKVTSASGVLADLLRDGDPAVVEVACWASGEIDAGVDHIQALSRLTTDHDDPLVREAAVAALGAIGDERGLPAILTATRDKATVRRRAVLALAPFDGPEVDAALRAALDDRDWQVRQAAEDLHAE